MFAIQRLSTRSVRGYYEAMDMTLGILSYLIPSFILGFVWHLKLFEARYRALEIYRDDVIIPFGLLSMFTQAVIFSYVYLHLIQGLSESMLTHGFIYCAAGALLSWSFSTLAVGAKNKMTSVRDFFVIETGYTVVQWVLVAIATVLVIG